MWIVYAIIAIIILALIYGIIRWRNLPEVIEQRRLAAEERAKRQAERRKRWFPRRYRDAKPEVSPQPEAENSQK